MAIVTLGDVAIESRETWKSDKNNIPIVGLEHLEPGEISLSKWDINSDNTFTKMFRKGQVLLGRRRVYLRKAVFAPTDGICSGDITVIEAIPGKILPELLPFIIQNDRFFDYAMQGSAGSLSPRVKWEHLKDYKFQLPNLEEQKALADKLWSAYNLKSSYNKLLAATDEMVKSQFIEMFEGDKYPKTRLGDFVSIRTGKLDANASSENGKYPFFTCGVETLKIDDYAFDCEAVLLAGNGEFCVKYYNGKFNAYQRTYVIETLDNNVISVPYLYAWFGQYAKVLRGKAIGGIIKYIKMGDLTEAKISFPPLEVQNSYVAIAQQADKSKFELGKSIESIDAVIKSLINS